MPLPLGQFIEENGPILLDGGLATTLESHGAQLDSHLWSAKLLIEAPEEIRWAHEQFLRSGSQVISSSSYQFSHDTLAAMGFSKSAADDLLRKSIAIAKQSIKQLHPGREEQFFVAASLGPFGATLGDGSEYTGNYGAHGIDQIMNLHDERMRVLSTTKADVFAFETIPRGDEALAIAQRMRDFPAWEFWLSFQLRDPECLANGDRFHDLILQLEAYDNLVAIGVNCLAPPLATQALKLALGKSKKPIFVYPNSGEVYNRGKWTASNEASDLLIEAEKWLKLGVAGIGGCCRTSPKTIAELAKIIEKFRRLP